MVDFIEALILKVLNGCGESFSLLCLFQLRVFVLFLAGLSFYFVTSFGIKLVFDQN